MKNWNPLHTAGILAILWIVLSRLVLPAISGLPVISAKPTAATYVYEKDSGSVPPPVLAALDKLNRQGIVATTFEDDTTDSTDAVPDQYKAVLPAAREAGLPSLVVTAGEKVLRTVKGPTTEEQVMEAAR